MFVNSLVSKNNSISQIIMILEIRGCDSTRIQAIFKNGINNATAFLALITGMTKYLEAKLSEIKITSVYTQNKHKKYTF